MPWMSSEHLIFNWTSLICAWCPVVSCLHTFLEQVWAVDFVTINFVFLVLLDWTSTSCAITFLVIWHVRRIMLACFTSKQSRYIFQLFLMIISMSPAPIQRKKVGLRFSALLFNTSLALFNPMFSFDSPEKSENLAFQGVRNVRFSDVFREIKKGILRKRLNRHS